MRVEDLGIGELVQFDTEDGVIRFAGERALIIDATAKGNLRKELISHFGVSAARAVLTRFGFVQGWRMAEAMRGLFEWEREEDWHRTCARMHMLEGMYCLGPPPLGSVLEGAPEVDDPLGLINRSPDMRHVVDLARRIARVDATALIMGESGTGKERIARLIHNESARTLGPFIAVNCGAISESLLESELFGHARGSFTDANQDRVGPQRRKSDPRGEAARYRHGNALPETQELPRRTSRPGHSPRVAPGALPTPRS